MKQSAISLLLLAGVLTSIVAVADNAAPTITVLSVQEVIPRGSLKTASAAVAVPEGGFLVAGGYRTDQYSRNVVRKFYAGLSSTGAVLWEQTSDTAWRTPAPTAALLLPEGGYAVLSKRFQKDVDAEIKAARRVGKSTEWGHIIADNQYDSIELLTQTGALQPETRMSELGDSRYIDCGLATRAGFIFAGAAVSPKETSWRGLIALIEMRGRDGKLLWEHQYPTDHDKALDISPQLGQTECGSVMVGPDDSATVVLNVRVLPVTQSSDEWVKAVSSANNHQGVLVVRLDSNGHELSRTLDENVTEGLLLAAQKQTLLVERTVPQLSAPSYNSLLGQLAEIKKRAASGYRIRLTYMDGTGNRAGSSPEVSGGALETVRAAYRTREGDLLLAGCPELGGNNYLVHVNSSGVASPTVELTPGGVQQCAKFVFEAGAHPREAAVLLTSDLVGAQLVTVKY
jgi:hypothetical protein